MHPCRRLVRRIPIHPEPKEQPMQVSTKGRHALAALIDVARHQPAGPVTLASVARRRKVSLSYLEQLFARLRQHQLVDSLRGPGGGYVIGRPADAISVADVVVAVDGFADDAQAPDGGPAGVDVWARLQRALIDYLDGITLQDLLDGRTDPEAVMPAVAVRGRRSAANDRTRAYAHAA
jgi:Rrf2 family iron-sulfur cluster assembly transcriptional regulator